MTEKPLVSVRNLKKYFDVAGGTLKAVDDVSFDIMKGETLGLVGESGCGKTTVGRTIIRAYRPTSGEIHFDGVNIADISERNLKPYRQRMQIIFQDPYASLNPRMTIGDIIAEPIDIHKTLRKSERQNRIYELLEQVNMSRTYASRYPHEFSGGQRQRVGIARALAANPDLIVCDEPISALDVSIQAQVVNLLEDLQKATGVTYLFIAHDLSMVQHISRRVGVMYLGHIMEMANDDELYDNPSHPYTQALLSAIPLPDPVKAEQHHRILLEGDVPTPINPPVGCPFCTRCRYVKPECKEVPPQLREIAPNHTVACHI